MVIYAAEKGGTNMMAGAGRDNLKLAYQGLVAEEFTSPSAGSCSTWSVSTSATWVTATPR